VDSASGADVPEAAVLDCVVVLNRLNVCRIDGVCQVEQAAGGGLLDEPVEDIVDNVFKTVRNRSTVSLDGGLSRPQ